MEQQKILKQFEALKKKRQAYVPQFEKIARYTATKVDPDKVTNSWGGDTTGSTPLDLLCDDPTVPTAVQKSAEYLNGLIWGYGQEGFVNIGLGVDIADELYDDELKSFYRNVGKKISQYMFHSDSGLINVNQEYFSDQSSFGTSGIGVFDNGEYPVRSSSPFVYKEYGVDNICIDEGNNSKIEYVYITYRWGVSRIVKELAPALNEFEPYNKAMFKKLPDRVQSDFINNKFDNDYEVIHAVLPNESFSRKATQGKNKARYNGYWFVNDGDKAIIKEEHYLYKPIHVCRMIKMRGEVYGRSYVSTLLNTVVLLNYVMQLTQENMEKLVNPALMSYGDVTTDGVIDTSANSFTVLDKDKIGGMSNTPIIPMYQVGDISTMTSAMIPYLKDAITSGMRVDVMMDFNSQADMTAREAVGRMQIRAEALRGMLMQQIQEMQFPLIDTTLSLMLDKGLIEDIPDAIKEAIQDGKQWYQLQVSDRVKLVVSDLYDKISKYLNILGAMAQFNPQIIQATDMYVLLNDVVTDLGLNPRTIKSEVEYKKIVQAMEQAAAQQQQIAQNMAGADINKTMAEANKAQKEANGQVR